MKICGYYKQTLLHIRLKCDFYDTCLHGARLSDSSSWNGPLNPLNVKIPLQLELKPWQNLLSRTCAPSKWNSSCRQKSQWNESWSDRQVFHTDSLSFWNKLSPRQCSTSVRKGLQASAVIGRSVFENLRAAQFGHSECICTQTFYTHDAPRHFHKQTLLHTDAFTHRRFYTQGLLHRFYTQTLLHRNFTLSFWHIYTNTFTTSFRAKEAFAHGRLWHIDAFTHSVFARNQFYTQTLLHSALLHTGFYTQTLLHRRFWNRNFTSVFDDRTFQLFVRKGCAFYGQTLLKSQFYLSFWRSNLISCERVARDKLKSQFYLSFWRSNLISCERVARDKLKSQFYLSFWRSNLISCERVAPDKLKSQFYPSFWRSNLISCERVAPDKLKSQFYLSFWRSNLISCERVARDKLKSQFYLSFWRSNLISCERVAFRAVSLPLPLLPPSRKK